MLTHWLRPFSCWQFNFFLNIRSQWVNIKVLIGTKSWRTWAWGLHLNLIYSWCSVLLMLLLPFCGKNCDYFITFNSLQFTLCGFVTFSMHVQRYRLYYLLDKLLELNCILTMFLSYILHQCWPTWTPFLSKLKHQCWPTWTPFLSKLKHQCWPTGYVYFLVDNSIVHYYLNRHTSLLKKDYKLKYNVNFYIYFGFNFLI